MSKFIKVDLNRDDIYSSLNGNVYMMDRLPTALESVKHFTSWVSKIGMKLNTGGGIMIGVGLTCASRGSCYIMVYDAKKKTIFSIDIDDENYVCEAV